MRNAVPETATVTDQTAACVAPLVHACASVWKSEALATTRGPVVFTALWMSPATTLSVADPIRVPTAPPPDSVYPFGTNTESLCTASSFEAWLYLTLTPAEPGDWPVLKTDKRGV